MNQSGTNQSKTIETNYAATRIRNNKVIAEAVEIVSSSDKTPESEALLLIFKGDRTGFKIVNAEFVYKYGDIVRKAYGIMKNRLKPWRYLDNTKIMVRKRNYNVFIKEWPIIQMEARLVDLGILSMRYQFVCKKGHKQVIIMLIRLLVDSGLCKKEINYAALMRHFMQEYNVPKLKRLNRRDSSLQAKVFDDFQFIKKQRSGHFAA